MKAKWLTLSVAVAIGIASMAFVARSQDRPKEDPVGTAEEGPGVPGEPGEMGELDDFDGLGLLLAAQVRGEPGGAPGHGPHGGMGRGLHGGMGPGGRGAEDLHKKLNLSDDQKTRLADIHDRQERAAVPIRADLRIASLDMRKLMRADKPDQRAIDAQIDRMASLRASLRKSHVAGLLEARAVLTPAQQKLMREHHGQMMSRHMRGGRGMHGGRGMRMNHF